MHKNDTKPDVSSDFFEVVGKNLLNPRFILVYSGREYF